MMSGYCIAFLSDSREFSPSPMAAYMAWGVSGRCSGEGRGPVGSMGALGRLAPPHFGTPLGFRRKGARCFA